MKQDLCQEQEDTLEPRHDDELMISLFVLLSLFLLSLPKRILLSSKIMRTYFDRRFSLLFCTIVNFIL